MLTLIITDRKSKEVKATIHGKKASEILAVAEKNNKADCWEWKKGTDFKLLNV